MKNKILVPVIVVVTIAVLISIWLAVANNGRESAAVNMVDSSDYILAHPEVSALPVQDLSPEEISGLVLMREEEKLAQDVYLALYDRWGLNIFRNIAASEATHTEAVRYLLQRYNLPDPVLNPERGVFTNKDLSALYQELVISGDESLLAALKVGATVEDLDIKDLQDLTAKTDNADIIEVYDNLMRGSRNHLRSFSRQLEKYDFSYQAQHISQAELQQILAGETERGR